MILFILAIFHTKIKIFNTEVAYHYPGGGMEEAVGCLLNHERDWYTNDCETYTRNRSIMRYGGHNVEVKKTKAAPVKAVPEKGVPGKTAPAKTAPAKVIPTRAATKPSPPKPVKGSKPTAKGNK
jgi:hypothetical protein